MGCLVDGMTHDPSRDMFQRLEQHANQTGFTLERIIKEHVAHGLLRRLTKTTQRERWVLRGSVLTQSLIAPAPRPFDDLDFLGLDAYDPSRALTRMVHTLNTTYPDGVNYVIDHMETLPIWEGTPFPGMRIKIPYQVGPYNNTLQVDCGYGDPLSCSPIQHALKTHIETRPLTALSVRAETMIAWKLHGLFELEKHFWRSKTLMDLWRLLTHSTFDFALLPDAIALAFVSRDTPLSRVDRLLEGRMGLSIKGQKRWREFAQEHPDRDVPDDTRELLKQTARLIEPCVKQANAIQMVPGTTLLCPLKKQNK
jgi:hypothetical protein